MKVYFSHTGIDNWKPCIEIQGVYDVRHLLLKLNDLDEYRGILNIIIENGKISSSTRVFFNIEVLNEIANTSLMRFYEKKETRECKGLSESLAEVENVLIAVYDASIIASLLDKAMKFSTEPFNFTNEDGVDSKKEFKPMIQEIDFNTEIQQQTLYEFCNGNTTLQELEYGNSEEPYISYESGFLVKNKSKILPADLNEAIRKIWGLEEGTGSLRLFQEDALFFIMEQLLECGESKEKQLLLSMPTGGGKTEAFMIPLIASIYHKKKKETKDRVKGIVIYPTNALANDQAMRFVELIYVVNEQLAMQGVPSNKLISIGILSGDTPNRDANLQRESLIQICPRCGKSSWGREGNTLICSDAECNTRLDFCRLTKNSILDSPPDILITNPDEINVSLHNPKMAPIFYSKIDSIVFDEVHVYQGIFGCHVAHLLRRLEELNESKPLYIGMSATIGNAQELAALLFNEKYENIKYINDKKGKYTDKSRPVKNRLHLILKPALISEKKSEDDKARYVRTMSVAGAVGLFIGHLITDSHFRKSIIFTNYRSEADDLATYVRQRERLDVDLYFKTIINKIARHESLTIEEVEICQYMYKWFDSIITAVKGAAPMIKVGWNRGGLEKETRIRSIHSFSRNNLLSQDSEKYPIDLMVATKSLEVGIDIGDVTTVINASAPFTANEYVQRVGRGGRKKDSMAITVLNPENAIDAYFIKHFKEYVEAKPDIFEDAPIILNNDIIIMRHIKARLIDYIVKSLYIYDDIKWNIKFGDIVEKLQFSRGRKISVGNGKTTTDVKAYVDCIYEAIFEREYNGQRNFVHLINFLRNETEILGTKLSDITEDKIKEAYLNIIGEMNSKLQLNARTKWELGEIAIGYGGKWVDLTPNLRGNGATVSLYIANSDDATDVVSRQTAFNQMPPASNQEQVVTVHSGVSTFRIDGNYGDTDGKTEKKIRQTLQKDSDIREYFHKKIETFPDIDDFDDFIVTFKVTVPNALQVSYFPSRFYCPTCKKGLIGGSDMSEIRIEKHGIYCSCGSKVEQLHEVYFCKECSSVYDPPVAKICLNPDCPDYKKFYADYKANNFKITKEIIEHFRFRLTKDLEWECEKCKCKMNFSSTKRMIISNAKRFNFVNKVIQRWQKDDTLEGVAIKFKSIPELFAAPRNRKSVFKCQHDFDHKTIDTIGVPRVRTASYNYIGDLKKEGPLELCSGISTSEVDISFKEGYVLQLATQFTRRYISGAFGAQTYRIKTENIYQPENGFNCLGNYYESHLAWIKFSHRLNEFISTKKYSCDGKCQKCMSFDGLDLGENMKPVLTLENYNFDSNTGKPKKPDYRGRYCKKAQDNLCISLKCTECAGGDFKEDEFMRYVIIHTIKHGILWAMPKYAGVNVSEIKGEVYPNDRKDNIDLVLIDNNEGGSGAIVLIQKHWNQIWEFAKEIISLTCTNEANILLNHNCSRNNADLCPFITQEFFKYLDE